MRRAASVLSLVGLLASVVLSVEAEPPGSYAPVPPSAFATVVPEPIDWAVPSPRPTPSARPARVTATPSRVTRRPPSHVTPTPRPVARTSRRLVGLATWYCYGRSRCPAGYSGGPYAAAGPALRHALGASWRGRVVTVEGPARCKLVRTRRYCWVPHVAVRLVDWCACGSGHTIDLFGDAFGAVSDLWRGVAPVSIRW